MVDCTGKSTWIIVLAVYSGVLTGGLVGYLVYKFVKSRLSKNKSKPPKLDQQDGIPNPGFTIENRQIDSDRLRGDLEAQQNYRENASPVIQSKQAAISLQGNLPKSEVEPNEQNYLELSTHSVEDASSVKSFSSDSASTLYDDAHSVEPRSKNPNHSHKESTSSSVAIFYDARDVDSVILHHEPSIQEEIYQEISERKSSISKSGSSSRSNSVFYDDAKPVQLRPKKKNAPPPPPFPPSNSAIYDDAQSPNFPRGSSSNSSVSSKELELELEEHVNRIVDKQEARKSFQAAPEHYRKESTYKFLDLDGGHGEPKVKKDIEGMINRMGEDRIKEDQSSSSSSSSDEVIKKMVEEKSKSSSDDEVTMKKIAFQRRNSSFSEDPSEEHQDDEANFSSRHDNPGINNIDDESINDEPIDLGNTSSDSESDSSSDSHGSLEIHQLPIVTGHNNTMELVLSKEASEKEKLHENIDSTNTKQDEKSNSDAESTSSSSSEDELAAEIHEPEIQESSHTIPKKETNIVIQEAEPIKMCTPIIEKLDDVSEEEPTSSSETSSSDEEENGKNQIAEPLENLYENFVPIHKKVDKQSSSSSSDDDEKPLKTNTNSTADVVPILEKNDNEIVIEVETIPKQMIPNKATTEVVSTSEDETESIDDTSSSSDEENNSEPKHDHSRVPRQIIQGLDRKSSGYGSGLLLPALPAEPIIPFEGDSSSSDEELAAKKKPIEKKWHIASINNDPITIVKPKSKPSESSSESSSEEEEENSVPKAAKAYSTTSNSSSNSDIDEIDAGLPPKIKSSASVKNVDKALDQAYEVQMCTPAVVRSDTGDDSSSDDDDKSLTETRPRLIKSSAIDSLDSIGTTEPTRKVSVTSTSSESSVEIPKKISSSSNDSKSPISHKVIPPRIGPKPFPPPPTTTIRNAQSLPGYGTAGFKPGMVDTTNSSRKRRSSSSSSSNSSSSSDGEYNTDKNSTKQKKSKPTHNLSKSESLSDEFLKKLNKNYQPVYFLRKVNSTTQTDQAPRSLSTDT